MGEDTSGSAAISAGQNPGSGRRAGLALSAWCIVAAFGTYFCMYAFRKPFTAGTWQDPSLFGIEYKTLLVTAQVLGYTLSKFLGIKFVAELDAHRRAIWIIGLIGCAEVSLFLFGLTPAPFNWPWLFLNGVPLGMVFGLVLRFLEGRQQTELLTAGLCTSFIVADGFMKSTGGWLLSANVPEHWMPFAAGLLFVVPLLVFVWMLTRIPVPSHQDIRDRSERISLNREQRWALFGRYATGLTLLLLVFLLITVLRSVRADFAPEIWRGLGYPKQPSVFAESELWVAAGILLLTGLVIFIKDNRTAFLAGMGLALAGCLLVALALLGLRTGHLSAFPFMVLHGLGLYLPYIVVHTILFERLLAMTRDLGNIGYLMTLADAFGYLGYVVVLLAKNILSPGSAFLDFFLTLSWIIAGTCVLLLVPCWRYFAAQPTQQLPEPVSVPA